MLASANLCAIPFLGHCDNSRLQMSAKQLSQAVTNPRCQVPKVIGANFRYLSDSSRMFKFTAPNPGDIIYVNDELMIANFNTPTGAAFEIFEVPPVMTCSGLYATRLRYRRDVGPFDVGDCLYEYDCFHQTIPTYGYNLMTAYMSFFGYNHEDSIILSEEAATRCCSTKSEQILIPIHTYSLFKMMYDGETPIGYFPPVGYKLKDGVVALRSQLKIGRNSVQTLKAMNLSELANVTANQAIFQTIPITTRIKDARVFDIRIHRLDKNKRPIDKTLQTTIENLRNQYSAKLYTMQPDIYNIFNDNKAIEQFYSKYYLLRNHIDVEDFDKKELIYILEIKVVGESSSNIGDKFANRYANKGVVSLILPNELRPIAMNSNKPIDSIVGPISVISRMNFGQIIEGLLAKAVTKAEEIILQDETQCKPVLEKLAKFADILGDPEYANNIRTTASGFTNKNATRQFMNSVRQLGLYFEAPNFANFNLDTLRQSVGHEFGIRAVEPVKLPRKLIQYVTEKLKINVPIPNEDVIMPNIFTAPIYTIKLKQESYYRSTARDFGNYKATNRQPIQGRNRDGIIASGSRLGQMELI